MCTWLAQVVVGDDTEGRELLASGKLTLGAALGVEGVVAESQGGKQAIEIKASVIRLVRALSMARQ